MSQQATENPSAIGQILGTFERMLPSYLDYRAGRDPNAIYTTQNGGQQSYMFAPRGDTTADRGESAALFGPGPIGAIPVSTVVMLAVGAFIFWKWM